MFKCMYNVTYIDTPLVELDLTQGFPTASMPFKKKLYLRNPVIILSATECSRGEVRGGWGRAISQGRRGGEGQGGGGKGEEGKGQVGTLGRRGREKFWEGVGREEEEGRACCLCGDI